MSPTGWIVLGVIAALVVIIILWIISAQRSLTALDENVNNAMSQIGVQLSSRWDALTALLDLTKGYAEHEYGPDSNDEHRALGVVEAEIVVEFLL